VIVQKEISFNEWESEIKSSLEYINAGIFGTVVDRKNNKITFEIGKDGLVMAVISLRHGLPVKGRAAIILDDLGYRKDIVEKYLKLKVPLTYAILPHAPFSKYLAKKITESGYDTLLHLPCEPESYPAINPGTGAIFVSMDAIQIKKTIMDDLLTVPQVIGASNHEGSKAMSDEKTVREILEVLKSLNLVFIDSKTTPKSKVKGVAKEINIKTIGNDVFLDNKNDYEYIAGQMEKLIAIAQKSRRVIAIGHIHNKETFAVISDYIPKLKKAGIELVGVSELMRN